MFTYVVSPLFHMCMLVYICSTNVFSEWMLCSAYCVVLCNVRVVTLPQFHLMLPNLLCKTKMCPDLQQPGIMFKVKETASTDAVFTSSHSLILLEWTAPPNVVWLRYS